MAGICGVATILALGLFSLFSILHVAMQLQRKEIWISFKRDVFAKLVTASLAGNFLLNNLFVISKNETTNSRIRIGAKRLESLLNPNSMMYYCFFITLKLVKPSGA